MNTITRASRMKRFSRLCLALVACCLSGNLLMGQTANQYAFNTTTGIPLDPMAGSTTLVGASSDDGTSGLQAIGFPFTYESTTYTQFSANVNGLVRLGATGVTGEFSNSFSSTTNTPKLMPSWDDHHTGTVAGGGKVHTVLVGSSPNQIRIIEWFVTIPRNTTGAANARFQCWLFEGSNMIQYRYGASGGTTASASYGLGGAAIANFVSLTTSAGSGTTSTVTANNNNTIWPGAGTLYQFTAPSCGNPGMPSGLTSTAITTNGATISWAAGAFATSYNYEVRSSGACGSGAAGLVASGTTASLSAAISGLAPQTTYTYCVRSTCTASSAFASGSFTTACASVSLPLSEGFNASSRPNCWTEQFVTGTSAINYLTTSSNPTTSPFEGSNFVRWNAFSISSGNSTRLVSPAIVTTGTASVDVNFRWYNENNPTYSTGNYLLEGVQVQWSLDGINWTDAGSLITRHDAGLPSGTGVWNLKTLTLPAAAGNQATIYVGFRFDSRFGDNCSMDALNITATPSCNATASVSASAVTANSATLSWAAVSGAVGYNYEVRTSGACGSGASGLVSSGTTASTSVNLTGLTDNTAYTVCVQTNCGAIQSSYNSGAFLTPFATPANDDCANAIPLSCGATASGFTNGATDDAGFPACTGTGNNFRGVWYQVTPAVSGAVTLSLCGSSFDTYLRVFSGACGSQSCVANNDDFCSLQSQVTFTATAGTTYYVLVSGFGASAFGAYTLNWTAPAPNSVGAINGPTSILCNDNATFSVSNVAGLNYNWSTTNGAIVSGQGTNTVTVAWTTGSGLVKVITSNSCGANSSVSLNVTCVAGPCSNVTPVACGASTSTTLGAGPGFFNPGGCFSTPGEESVYSFTAPTSGSYSISVTSTSGTDYFDYYYKLASAGCGSTGWTCIDDINSVQTSGTFNLTAGNYLILVDKENFLGNTATITQSWNINCPPPPPANDDCANATPFTGSSVAFTTVSATGADIASCGFGNDNNDVWFAWTAPYCGRATFTTCGGATFDTHLSLWTGCGTGEVACNDDTFSGGCNLQSTVSATVVAGQTYYVRVAGYNGAQGSGTVFASITPQLNGTASATNVSCFGGNNGSASIAVSGGVTPYTYAWSNGGTSASLSGLVAGAYSVVVTDANGCTVSASVTVSEPTALAGTLLAQTYVGGVNVSCFGATDGSIFANISGGTAPYSYAWSNGGNSQMLPNLGAGTYSVVVTDANGCTLSLSTTLSEPAPMANTISAATFACGFNVSCNGANDGAINLTVTGGSGNYSFSWSNGATSEDLSGLTAGTYSVVATDQNGCSTSASITLTQPATLSASLNTSVYTCGYGISCFGGNNGSISATVTGGCAPYSYAWSATGNGSTINGLSAGTYNVTVTDANGCQAFATAELTQPTPVTVSCSPNTTVYYGWAPNACATVSASGIGGGCGPYSILWSNGATTPSITVCPTVSTNYTVTVTDANGCTATCVTRVCVIDVRCGNNLQKIEICHNGNSLCVSPNAVANHLSHGDYLGSCGSNVACASGNKSDETATEAEAEHNAMMMEAFPNPFQTATTLRFAMPSDDNVTVTVFAMDGRSMGTLFAGAVEANKTYEVDFKSNGAAAGIYFARLVNAKGEVSNLKLVLMD